jgi:SAM-dependent methyltransferase
MTAKFDKMFSDTLRSGSRPVEVRKGIPIFLKRTKADRERDKYDKDDVIVTIYTGLAFGFKSSMRKGHMGIGGTEGLYRTVSSFLTLPLRMESEYRILDVGCGVGRTIYDCAPSFRESLFVGMEFSYEMCRRAKEILIDGLPVRLDGRKGKDRDEYWAGRGFPSMVFTDSLRLNNVKIAQGSATQLPFKDGAFDCVVSTFLVDRVWNPLASLKQMARVLKKGGHFVLATPMNFSRWDDWSRFKDAEGLVKAIEAQGIAILEKFDGLPYREILDRRRNFLEWLAVVVYGEKL